MACLKLLPSIILFTVAMVGAETREERYEDLVESSMQSVVALNEVVSNFAVQLAQISTSLLDVRLTLQQTENSVRALEKRIEDQDIERKKSLKSLEQEVVDLRAETDEVANLTSSLSLAMKAREVMIVSGEQPAGDERCMKVCAGSTGRSTTDWTYYSSSGIYEDVDMSDCGFTAIPTVTTSIEGRANHWEVRGSSSVYSVSTTSFRIYLQTSVTESTAETKLWNVEWIAVGYTC